MMDLRTRLLAKVRVQPCGCWLWTGAKRDSRVGYGEIRVFGKRMGAHRASYEAFIGPIPDGLFVCHHCDTPSCINPSHLYAGSNRENVMDAVRRGRWVVERRVNRGENHGMSKLDDIRVRKIRAIGGSLSQSKIAAMFGVSPSVIGEVLRRETWKHVQ